MSACASCNSEGELHRHHLIPRVYGGANAPTVLLCLACHGLVHGKEFPMNHRHLTKAALAATKARGTVLGGYRGGPAPTDTHRAKATAAKQAKATSRARDLAPLLASIRAEGHESLSAMAQALNAKGIPTARGCAWTPTAVKRVLELIDNAKAKGIGKND